MTGIRGTVTVRVPPASGINAKIRAIHAANSTKLCAVVFRRNGGHLVPPPPPACYQRIRGQINNPSLIVMIGVFSDPSKVSIVLEELNGEGGSSTVRYSSTRKSDAATLRSTARLCHTCLHHRISQRIYYGIVLVLSLISVYVSLCFSLLCPVDKPLVLT